MAIKLIAWRRRFVASGLSFQESGCDPGPVYVRYVMAKVTPEEVFHKYFSFPVSLSFHYYFILVFFPSTTCVVKSDLFLPRVTVSNLVMRHQYVPCVLKCGLMNIYLFLSKTDCVFQ